MTGFRHSGACRRNRNYVGRVKASLGVPLDRRNSGEVHYPVGRRSTSAVHAWHLVESQPLMVPAWTGSGSAALVG